MNEPIEAVRPPAKPRRHFSLKQQADYLERFLQSGLRVSEFCRQHQLSPSCLQRWLKKLQAPDSAPVSAPPEQPLFREIPLAAAVGSVWAVELSRPNGTVLRLAQTLSPQLLEQLLRAC